MAFVLERDEQSAAFFDGAARGQLMIRRCPNCETFYPPHQSACPDGNTLEWVATDGTATLVTWVVDHGAVLDPLLAGFDPSTSIGAMVEVPEGPWLTVPLVGVDPSTLRLGTPLRVRFVPVGSELIPVFGPVSD